MPIQPNDALIRFHKRHCPEVLPLNTEILGELQNIQEDKDHLTLTFVIHRQIQVSKDLAIIKKLYAHIGDKIAMLNADTHFFVREIERARV